MDFVVSSVKTREIIGMMLMMSRMAMVLMRTEVTVDSVQLYSAFYS